MTNPDGSEEVLNTSWVEDRKRQAALEREKDLVRAAELKEHLAVKREKPREPKGGRGT